MAAEKVDEFILYLEGETQRNLGVTQRQFYSSHKSERVKPGGRMSYYLCGSRLKNYTSGNQEARSEIKKLIKFMANNLQERLPRLHI